jgi:hypothetical protein
MIRREECTRCAQGVGFEIDFFIFNFPLPQYHQQLEMMLQGGFGDFTNLLSQIRLGGCIAQSIANQT